jgi:hypothetical protein
MVAAPSGPNRQSLQWNMLGSDTQFSFQKLQPKPVTAVIPGMAPVHPIISLHRDLRYRSGLFLGDFCNPANEILINRKLMDL